MIVTVEAPIAAGKSTLLKLIASQLGDDRVVVVPEPLEKWQDVDGAGNLLECFYSDPIRYAYTFETYLLLSRVQALEAAQRGRSADTVYVLERSWVSSRFVFGELTRKNGQLTDLEWALYKRTYDHLARGAPKVDGHIFLNVSAETAVARMKKRDRSEEASVPMAYQEALASAHNEWLGATETPVLEVNGNLEFEASPSRQGEVLASIRGFLASIECSVTTSTPLRAPLRALQPVAETPDRPTKKPKSEPAEKLAPLNENTASDENSPLAVA